MTEFMQHLLDQYGETIFIDATYNVDCEESIMYIVTVLTNDGYEPVMISLIPDETSENVGRQLAHLKERMNHTPKFIMMDDSAAYQKAAKSVFPG